MMFVALVPLKMDGVMTHHLIVMGRRQWPTHGWNLILKYQNVIMYVPPKSQQEHKDGNNFPEDIRRELIRAIMGVCHHGILAHEPMAELQILIHDIKISSNPEESNYFELSTMVNQGFRQAVEEAQPVLLEPILRIEHSFVRFN